MRYRGKVKEQEAARVLRAEGHTLAHIAAKLGVSKSSVSLWVRDVPFTPSPRRHGPHRRPHPAHEAKLRQIEDLNRQGATRIGVLGDEEFFVAGVALYAGEGSKGVGEVRFTNSDPGMVRFFCARFRRFFDVDEQRVRGRIYLHEGLDLVATEAFLVGADEDPAYAVSQAVPRYPGSEYPDEQARAWMLLCRVRVLSNASRSDGARKGFGIVRGSSGVAQ